MKKIVDQKAIVIVKNINKDINLIILITSIKIILITILLIIKIKYI